MKSGGLLFMGLGAATLAFIALQRKEDVSKLNVAMSNFFKLSNIHLFDSMFTTNLVLNNPGTRAVTYNNLLFKGGVNYGTTSLATINQGGSVTLNPGETKQLSISAKLDHTGLGTQIISLLTGGSQNAKLLLKGTLSYGIFNIPVNLDLIQKLTS